MNLYRITGKQGNWIANVRADRIEWIGHGVIHFYRSLNPLTEVYAAGFYPYVEVELDGVKLTAVVT